jgi:hypothetical protein
MAACATFAVVICWLPCQAYSLAAQLGYAPVETVLHQVLNLLAFFNSCLNPALYAFTNGLFRKKFSEIFTRVTCHVPSPSDLPSTLVWDFNKDQDPRRRWQIRLFQQSWWHTVYSQKALKFVNSTRTHGQMICENLCVFFLCNKKQTRGDIALYSIIIINSSGLSFLSQSTLLVSKARLARKQNN